jgi:hypothetical protein
MTTILTICLGLWIAKAAYDICIGLLQILACIAVSLLGITLALLAYGVEIIIKLWSTALGISDK